MTVVPKHLKPGGAEKSWEISPVAPCETTGAAEKSFQQVNKMSLQEVSRARAARLLKVAFPGSDAQTAEDAALFLGCSERSVLNWLAGTHSMTFDAVFAIGCRVGVFVVMDCMTLGQGRATVFGLIAQGVRRVCR